VIIWYIFPRLGNLATLIGMLKIVQSSFKIANSGAMGWVASNRMHGILWSSSAVQHNHFFCKRHMDEAVTIKSGFFIISSQDYHSAAKATHLALYLEGRT
jgi:hypothetical protein